MKKLSIIVVLLAIFTASSFAQSYNDFTLPDLDGNDVTLSKLLENGPVLISFWATWCTPCKEEMKKLQPLHEKYKDQGFTYLAVNLDNQKSVSKVKSYISANGYTFPVVLDLEKTIFEAYSGVGMPYSILIDKNRKIVAKHLGYVPGDEKKIEQEIVNALGSQSESEAK